MRRDKRALSALPQPCWPRASPAGMLIGLHLLSRCLESSKGVRIASGYVVRFTEIRLQVKLSRGWVRYDQFPSTIPNRTRISL